MADKKKKKDNSKKKKPETKNTKASEAYKKKTTEKPQATPSDTPKRKNDRLKGVLLLILMIILFVAMIFLIFRMVLPNNTWKTFEKSSLYESFDNRGNGAYLPEKIKEPYVVIHSDMEDMSELSENYQVWDVLGCSEGMITKSNLEKMKTIVICESNYDVRNYSGNSSSEGKYGYSEYVKIYAIDVETGGYYVGKGGEKILAKMEATSLPAVASTPPKYEYRESTILKYVKENISDWIEE